MDVQQTVAAAEQSLWEIGAVLTVIVFISYAFSYAVTHVAKQYRKDHNILMKSLSSSMFRSILLALVACIGATYLANRFGALTSFAWIDTLLFAMLTSPWAPLAWPHVANTLEKLRDALIEKVKR